VVAHLGRVEDILRLTRDERTDIKVSSVTSGAVTALHHLAQELDIIGKIDRALENSDGRVQKRDGLSVGESLLAGMISRACAPRSKRAFAAWAETTALPEVMGFAAKDLDSQHFWDQMHALPVTLLGDIEEAIVRRGRRHRNNYNHVQWPTTPPTSTPISPARTRDLSCRSAGTTNKGATICGNWGWLWWWIRIRIAFGACAL